MGVGALNVDMLRRAPIKTVFIFVAVSALGFYILSLYSQIHYARTMGGAGLMSEELASRGAIERIFSQLDSSNVGVYTNQASRSAVLLHWYSQYRVTILGCLWVFVSRMTYREKSLGQVVR